MVEVASSEKTDPAREIVELCNAVMSPRDQQMLGETHLASRFGVKVWSKEFYEIIFTISERIDLLATIIGDLEIDEDFRGELVEHVRDILGAFSGAALRNHWSADGQGRVGPRNVQPLKGVTGLVRAKVAYKKLSGDEINEVKAQVDQLGEWLTEHQLAEQDFIRQALLEGLKRFRFRLDKLQWLGWGYTLDSLREVIAAYMLLERGNADPISNPDAAAVLAKTGAMIKLVFEKVELGEKVTKAVDWLAKGYMAGSVIYHGGPVVKALLGVG